jgi:hypothetical protein
MLIQPSPTPTSGPCMPRSEWAGSPAACSPTAPRPSAPLRSRSGWAVSMPPHRSLGPLGRRCARPSPATASACRPATRGGPPARHRRGQRTRRPARRTDPGPDAHDAQPRQLSARRGPDAEQGVRLRRAEEIETLSYRTVVELNAEAGWRPSGGWPPSPAVPNAPAAGQRPDRPRRPPSAPTCHPHRPQPTPEPAAAAS